MRCSRISAVWIVAAVATAVFVLSIPANAGTIVVSPLTNNESDIVNLGTTVVSAANFGSQAGGNATVDINGIIHPVASAANNGTGADLISGVVAINSTFDGNYRSGQASGAGYTGDMLNLMGGIAGRTAPGPISLDISGLNVGTDYLFQGYWEANNFGQTASVTFEGTDTQAGITGVGGLGTLISYTFTAGDVVLDADLSKTAGSDNIWWLGYSLQEAPSGSGPANVPVFAYPFPAAWDGTGTTLVDQSLANHDGSIISGSAALSSDVPAGKSGNSMDVAGSQTVRTDDIDLLDNPLVEANGGFTMDVWFNPTAGDLGARRKLIDYAGTEAINIENGSLTAYIADGVRLTHSGSLTADTWHHAIMRFDTDGNTIDANGDILGNVFLSLDGVEESATGVLLTDFGDSLNRPIGLGAHPFGADQFGGLLYNPSVSLGVATDAAIPEPSTFVLAALGLLGLGFFARRRRRK